MNNFTFGNALPVLRDHLGGSGAGDGFDGTSVVQTNMTNSRLTDPEVLEFRFPVRLDSYEIRAGSGGAGRWRGGDGGVRGALPGADDGAILSNGRVHAPSAWPAARRARWAATACSAPMAASRSWAHRPGRDAAGDVFVIETPGGGGYGLAPAAPAREISDTGAPKIRR
jgi:5-oxoprolinase (ATP-hydrolysing)